MVTDPVLRLDVVPARDSVFVVVHGELDLSTAPVVAAEIASLRARGFARVVLDLRVLEFMDSTGVALIADQLDEGPFAIVPGRGQPAEVLELTGVLGTVPVVRERDAPLAPAAHG